MKSSIRKLVPVLIVILGFFTLGASDLIWIYYVSDRLDRKKLLPMKQLALTVITFGIYGIFWIYSISSEMNKSKIIINKRTIIICVILSVFFLRNLALSIIYQALENTQPACVKDCEK